MIAPTESALDSIPAIDISDLLKTTEDGVLERVGHEIDVACRRFGFFTIVGHGVDRSLRRELERCSSEFFALDVGEKSQIAMSAGGKAWRGWFPAGKELTAGLADAKEGIYFGTDLAANDPRVRTRALLHGPNLWPKKPAEMRLIVAEWMNQMGRIAGILLSAMGVGLGLGPDWFESNLTAEPTELFRIFHYPPTHADAWGVGEHTDYGLLTILAQDSRGGLQVKTLTGWVDVPPNPEQFVCNIGDMLDRMTGGRYRSTPHRVLASRNVGRLSFPYFFDPGWNAEVYELDLPGKSPDGEFERWDGTSLRELGGTYGDYLTAKVSKVFPQLFDEV